VNLIGNKGDFTKYATLEDFEKDWLLIKPVNYEIKLEDVVKEVTDSSSTDSSK
jgi:hypothetical protein